MPRDSNQVYTLPEAAFQPNTVAQPTPVNNNFSDIATALTASLTRGETTPYTRTLLDDADAAAARATLGVRTDTELWGGTAGGTANAVTLSLTPAITAYATGTVIRFVSAAANTGAVTVNVNGVGAVALNKGAGTTPLAAGDIPSGHIVTITYDGTRFVLVGVVSAYGATLGVSATAAAARTTLGATVIGSALFTAASTTGARSAIVAAADPTTSPGGPGSMQALNSGSGSQLEAPAGGVWICWWLGYSTTTFTLTSIFEVAEVAGGTLLKAGAPNIAYIGIAFRKS